MENKTLKIANYRAKDKELFDAINAKARELQIVTEKVNSAKKECVAEAERKNRLRGECLQLELNNRDARAKLEDYRHLTIEAEGNKELHARKAKELKEEHDKLQKENLLLSKQMSGVLESIEAIQKDYIDRQKAIEGLRNLANELGKENTQTAEQVKERWAKIEEKEKEMKSIAKNQQETYVRMVTFAGLIEHNTRRLNSMYSSGKINIKIPLPQLIKELPEWKPFNS